MQSKYRPSLFVKGLILVMKAQVPADAAISYPVSFATRIAQMHRSVDPKSSVPNDCSTSKNELSTTSSSEEVLTDANAHVFRQLLEQWRSDAKPTSMMRDRTMHPAYLRIISLGPGVLPLILRELQRQPEPWFWALEAITGENPVSPSDFGYVGNMVDAWLEWGRSHGHLA